MKAWIKSSWYMTKLIYTAFAMKHFSSLDDVVGGYVFVPSLAWNSPLQQVLAFNLSSLL